MANIYNIHIYGWLYSITERKSDDNRFRFKENSCSSCMWNFRGIFSYRRNQNNQCKSTEVKRAIDEIPKRHSTPRSTRNRKNGQRRERKEHEEDYCIESRREKRCTKCLNIKSVSEFYKDNKKRDGLTPTCKVCHKQIKRLYYKNNKGAILAKQKQWRDSNPTYHKKYHSTNRNHILKLNKTWRETNLQKASKTRKRWLESTNNRLAANLRSRLSNILRYHIDTHNMSAITHVGCSMGELVIYLEERFCEGMSWNNYGRNGWHVDHIIPLSSFDLTNPEELKKACHYTNLQPLWATDNLKKSNKLSI